MRVESVQLLVGDRIAPNLEFYFISNCYLCRLNGYLPPRFLSAAAAAIRLTQRLVGFPSLAVALEAKSLRNPYPDCPQIAARTENHTHNIPWGNTF